MSIGKITAFVVGGIILDATIGLMLWSMTLNDKMRRHYDAGLVLAEKVHEELMREESYRNSPPSLRRTYAELELKLPLKKLCKELEDRHSKLVQKYVLDNLIVICNQ